jgi:F-type H+-transporting ATPase subunit gamma
LTALELYFDNFVANFSAFEVDDEVLSNMREYGLANSLYWALAEGHACEQSARRNAMDVSIMNASVNVLMLIIPAERLQERR